MFKKIFYKILIVSLLISTCSIPVSSVELRQEKQVSLTKIGEEGIKAKIKYKKSIEKIVEELSTLAKSDIDEKTGAEVIYRMATLQYKELNMKEKAIDSYLNCIGSYPNNKYSANSYHQLAEIYVKYEKNYYAAIKILDDCAKRYGNLDVGRDARFKMIYIFKDKIKDMDRAIDAYNNYIYLYPEKKVSAKLCEELSDIYLEKGDFDKAKELLEKISDLFPGSEESKEGHKKLALLYRDRRDYKNEAKTFELYITKYPNDKYAPKAAFTIGEIYEKNLIKYRRKRGYTNPKTRKKEPLYKLVRGSFREAIEKYKIVYEKYPKSDYAPRAMLKISEIYGEKLYEKSNVQEILNQLIEKYPNSKEAGIAKKMIKK